MTPKPWSLTLPRLRYLARRSHYLLRAGRIEQYVREFGRKPPRSERREAALDRRPG